MVVVAVLVTADLYFPARVEETFTGTASWYKDTKTASGARFKDAYFAAMQDVPFGTRVRVTNLNNKRTVQVTINDRGPEESLVLEGRVIDLTPRAFRSIVPDGKEGIIPVKVQVLKPFLAVFRRR